MSFTKFAFISFLMTPCYCLLHSDSSQYSSNELFTMIQQMNNTINHMETVIAQQNSIITGLQNNKGHHSVGFHTVLSHTISNLGDTETIEFDQVHTNVGNGYDPRHGHFTAPVSGLYLISASVMSTPGHQLYCDIVKNGQIVSRLYGATNDYQAHTNTFVIELQSGDMMWVRHNSGKFPEIVNGFYTYFSGALISS